MSLQPGKKAILIAIILLLLIVFSISGIKLLTAHQKTRLQATAPQPINAPERIATGDGSYTIATNNPNQMKFVSEKLGISFLYPSKINISTKYSQLFTVKEVGNKVYLYDPEFGAYIKGYYLEVFYKDPQDSLEMAIKETLLVGYSPRDCFVKNNIDPNIYPHIPAHFASATISFPGYTGSDNDLNAAKCPMPYTMTSGIEYFLMDKNHPDKFVFFHIGQDNIVTEEGRWNNTIQFLP